MIRVFENINNKIMMILIYLILSFLMVTIAGTTIPVTYSCCRNYTTSNGISIDDFENISNWTLSNPNLSRYDMQVDTKHFKEGTQGLMLTSHNGYFAVADKNIHIDFSKTKNFVFYAYIYNVSTLQYVQLFFTSTNDWSRYKSVSIMTKTTPVFHNGWNRLVVPTTNNSKNSWFTGTDDWNNVMTKLRLKIASNTDMNTSVTFDDLRYNMTGRAKAMFNFDDATKSTYTIALHILDSNGQRGTTFVIINDVNRSGYMTLYELKDLQSHGWDISSHTVFHTHLSTLDNTSLIDELNNSYDWLVNNGFQKSAQFIAYPSGDFNDAVLQKVEQRYILGRTTLYGRLQSHVSPDSNDVYNDAYLLRWISAPDNSTDSSDMINDINETIDEGGLVILTYHNIINSSNDQTAFTSKALRKHIQNVSNYLKSRSRDIDVITYSDYVNVDNSSIASGVNNNTSDNKKEKTIPQIHIAIAVSTVICLYCYLRIYKK